MIQRRDSSRFSPARQLRRRSLREHSSQACRWSGILFGGPPAADDFRLHAIQKGLNAAGFVEGQNVASNIAGRKTTTIGCRSWLPSS